MSNSSDRLAMGYSSSCLVTILKGFANSVLESLKINFESPEAVGSMQVIVNFVLELRKCLIGTVVRPFVALQGVQISQIEEC